MSDDGIDAEEGRKGSPYFRGFNEECVYVVGAWR
jgi:hypothetical protein